MGRPIDPKCLACCQLEVETARQLHGEQGDGCWNEKTCHRRRSHYRHRLDVNQKRKGQRAIAKVQQQAAAQEAASLEPPAIPVLPKVPAVALLYLYKQKRQDAPLHALAIAVWQGDRKLEAISPIHLIGMTNSQVNQYLREVLTVLQQRYGVQKFEPEIYLDPHTCPIDPCPLKGL